MTGSIDFSSHTVANIDLVNQSTHNTNTQNGRYFARFPYLGFMIKKRGRRLDFNLPLLWG